MRGSVVLITGANGFLGRHLIAGLVREHATVHALSRSVASEPGGARWWQGDLTDLPFVRKLVDAVRPDVIFQLASASQGGQDARWVMPAFESDLLTTVHTLLAAKECGGPRVIITGSLDEPFSGSLSQAPPSPYAAAKSAARLYGRMFHEVYGIPVTVLRPFMTYGPGQKVHKLIPYTILSLLKGESPQLSSGTRLVDWVYVEDVIAGFVAAARQPEAAGQEIDLGSGTLIPVREVVEEIRRLIPDATRANFGSLSDRLQEQVRSAEPQGALSVLGWKATTPLQEGLRKTVAWYRERMVPGTSGA